MSVETSPEKGQSKSVGSGSSGSTRGYWRSPSGENHGRDSRPGDIWHEPGDITDTDRLNWLIAGGYCPAEWRPATREELRAGRGRDNGQIMVGMGDRKTIDAAMLRSSSNRRQSATRPERGQTLTMKPKQSKTKPCSKEGRTASLRCDAIVSLLIEAQEAMENLPMGGIGRDGATQAEIDEAEDAGHPLEHDASYHQGQKTWLILERAKALLANPGNEPRR